MPSNEKKLRLYSVEMNPYCDRVKLILDAKEIPYEILEVNPACPPKSLLNVCPNARVPTLEIPDHQGALYESMIIVDYLEEAYPSNAMFATDAYRRGEDRILIEKFNKIIMGIQDALETEGSAGGSVIIENLLHFERALSVRKTKFFAGHKPGFVDYMIWPWMERLAVIQKIDREYYLSRKGRYPLLSEWAVDMVCDPIVQRNCRTIDDYYKYYRSQLYP